jgi:predicted nucleic acid-binding Zn ribbon protein
MAPSRPPGPRGPSEPKRVSDSLPEAARIIGARGAIELATVRQAWPEIVGPQAAAHAWPKAFASGVLTVATDHHAWATELRLVASDLLNRLQGPCPAVQSIVVVVSPGPALNW